MVMFMKEHNYFSFLNNTACANVIQHDIDKNQIHHAYMIVAGESETANMFARFFAFKILCKHKTACLQCENCKKALSGSNADFKVYPKNKNIMVEDISDITENAFKTSIEGTEKVFLLKNFENANQTAQNKILNTLEEPPANTHLILSVSNSAMVLQTIKSRCKIVNADNFSNEKLQSFLVSNGYSNEQAQVISIFSNGNIGSAISNINNPMFHDLIKVVFDLFLNCNKSSDMLFAVNNILKYKGNLNTIFELIEIVVNKALMVKNADKEDINEIVEISEKFSTLSLNAINNQIAIAKEKLQFNCNINSVVDMFVLKFLEEKYKWK